MELQAVGSETLDIKELLQVLTAVKNGDFAARMSLEYVGLAGKVADTLNTIIETNSRMALELERISTVVGKEGQISQRATIGVTSGQWADMVVSVNTLISDMVQPTAETARVIRAVARGDLSQSIPLEIEGRSLKGEFLQTALVVNTMVDQLNSFASEVTRVAREVGTEGNLGGQAAVVGVAGTWKDLTDNVNLMANNLTNQVRNIAEVTTAVANGDLSKKITVEVKGEILDLKNTINTMVDQLNSFASEVTRVAREVGTEGNLGGQAAVVGVAGTWKDLTDNVNLMANNLTNQVRNIAEVTTAVANGDLSKKITVEVKGEILDLKETVNKMVDQLNFFASEVTRVAREVGTEGNLGGQAQVAGAAGTWKDLTDNVNLMANNLTDQVRGIARVVTAVANGDLKQKLALGAKGEIAALADTINEMIDTLATFADQVTTVAREVGMEGKLGGAAVVPSAAGTWRHLTDNVNQLASNLTTQVRAIGEVVTAVTLGDLTRSITVDAPGELSDLKVNINQMIANLRETTRKNTEQDWLKTNLARFTRMLQGQHDLETVSKEILAELAPLVQAQHGVFFIREEEKPEPLLKLISSYAYKERKGLSNRFRFGEGLVGQCALEKERILITDVPNDYIRINSGLGEARPLNVVVLPVLFEGQVTAVIELASFYRFSDIHLTFLDQLTESIAIVLNTIGANMRTESLLKQSQLLTEELQKQQAELTETNRRLEQQARSLQASEDLLRGQQEELRKTNEELEEKAHLLEDQNHEVERKNREIEQAKQELEEKAEQLALSSRYKSEFLANMSHELRTPLNSILLLSQMLSENFDANLSDKQVEFADTIYTSGTDLLVLINDILDLAKIESGTMTPVIDEVKLVEICSSLERSFREVAHEKSLDFNIQIASETPTSMHTDGRRLQQILKNLLSNAFKFTEQGRVTLSVELVNTEAIRFKQRHLRQHQTVVAFSVNDTGIGIHKEKQQLIFEAFQQADGTTSRKYGGTGLGLSISRELAEALGGEISVQSEPGKGSTFTLYLPLKPTFLNGITREIPLSMPVVERSRNGDKHPTMSTWGLGIPDDRYDIVPGDRRILIVEDDKSFAQILLNLSRTHNYKGIVTSTGDNVQKLAEEYQPDAITLDIQLPEMDGWKVLDHLKSSLTTSDIPVHVISVTDDIQRSLRVGAVSHLRKPVGVEELKDIFRRTQQITDTTAQYVLLAAHPSDNFADVISTSNGVEVIHVASGLQAINELRERDIDCLILSQDLLDMTCFEFIETMQKEFDSWQYPIILYSENDLVDAQQQLYDQLAQSITITNVHSRDNLLNRVTHYRYLTDATKAPVQKPEVPVTHKTKGGSLAGKTILIIDDDVRNIFATTSILERHELNVVYALDGWNGIEKLRNTPEIDLVLMDIMMPNIDGNEAIRIIRAMPEYQDLPIIALTAKAMPEDRANSLQAGATDYVTKPVEIEKLLFLIRHHLKVTS